MKRFNLLAAIVLAIISILLGLWTLVQVGSIKISSVQLSHPVDTSEPLHASSPMQTGAPLQTAGPLMPAMPLQSISPPLDDVYLGPMNLGDLSVPADIPFAGWEWYVDDETRALIKSVLAHPTAESLAAAITVISSSPPANPPYNPPGWNPPLPPNSPLPPVIYDPTGPQQQSQR